MNTLHTIKGTIDNATNITEALSMLTSKYKYTSKLTIEDKGCYPNEHRWNRYEFTLEYKEEL